MMTLEALSCAFYDAPISAELERELSDLYQNAFSVVDFFKQFHEVGDPHGVKIFSSDSKADHILCYDIKGKCADILNGFIDIDSSHLEYVCAVLFERHPGINKINFNKIKSTGQGISSPFRIWSCSLDIVVPLPASVEEYDARLGKKIKRNMRYYFSKLESEYPAYEFKVCHGADIEPAMIREVISLNRARMESKSIRSGYDSALENNVIEFSRRHGAVATVSIEGKVVAGIICYDMGDNVFGEMIAHDSDYSEFSIGQICFYLTLKYFIKRGAKSFHTMEGAYAYKYRFLGENRNVISMSVYRSAKHKLLDIAALVGHKREMLIRQIQYCRTVLTVAARNRQLPTRRKATVQH